MQIIIKRIKRTTFAIDGQIHIDGRLICSCAENLHTRLHAGTYSVRICKCRFYGRKMPIIAIVPDDTTETRCCQCIKQPNATINSTPHHRDDTPLFCPMIKPGNGVHHLSDGSILVGQYLTSGAMIHPKDTFLDLYDRLRKSASRGHQLTLTIKE